MKTNTKLLIFLLFVLGIFSVISIASELDRRFFHKDSTLEFGSKNDHEIRYKEEYFEPDSGIEINNDTIMATYGDVTTTGVVTLSGGSFATSGSGDAYYEIDAGSWTVSD